MFITKQLIISRFDHSHEADFYALNSHPEVMRYIRPVKTEHECRDFLRENIRLYRDGSVIGRYRVSEKTTQTFAGTFSVLMMPDRDAYHIGYALMPWAQGRGWARELVLEGAKWFFSQTDQQNLYAITEPVNEASIRVLEKSSFLFFELINNNETKLAVYIISRGLL